MPPTFFCILRVSDWKLSSPFKRFLKTAIQNALLRDMLVRSRVAVALSIPVAVLVCFVHYGNVPAIRIGVWLACMIVIQSVRAAIFHACVVQGLGGRGPAFWRGLLQLSTMIAGATWGAMLFVLDSGGGEALLILRLLALAAILGTSLNSLNAFFRVYATFVASIALVIWLFLFDPCSALDAATRTSLSAATAVYVMYLLVVGSHGIKVTVANFSHQLEREDELARLRLVSEKDGELHRQLQEKARKLEESNFKLQYMARNDALTGIPNRRYLMEELERSIKNAERHPYAFSVILLDIDHFKKINDTCGHLAGDQVLVVFADHIAKHLREMDIVGRWGGEEFLCLLPNTPFEEAVACAERLRLALNTRELIKECPGQNISASFGVTTYQPGEPLNELIRLVDTLLYEAKSGGRNCVSGKACAVLA